MFRFDYFLARWNLYYPPNRSSIQAGPPGAFKRSLITKTRCETLHPWAAYALIRVSASQIEFRTLERALPYNLKGALADLSPGNEHGPDNQRYIGMLKYQCFNLPIEWQSPHGAGPRRPLQLLNPEMQDHYGEQIDQFAQSVQQISERDFRKGSEAEIQTEKLPQSTGDGHCGST